MTLTVSLARTAYRSGRIAMLAFLGVIVPKLGINVPSESTPGRLPPLPHAPLRSCFVHDRTSTDPLDVVPPDVNASNTVMAAAVLLM